MITFQDFQQAQDKVGFIYYAINNFINSDTYKNSISARKYYRGENPTILNRMNWIYGSQGQKVEDKFRANNKIPSEILSYVINQLNSYLLGNGVFVNEDIKKGLGKGFDIKLFDAGINCQLDSVSWVYCFIDEKNRFNQAVFKGNEFIPLYDELTSNLMAGIRFWSVSPEKPLMVELYEKDGKSVYKFENNSMKGQIVQEKTPYLIQMSESEATGEVITDTDNWSVIPIFPLVYNDKNTGVLTVGLQRKIDAYDLIQSDFVNNLEDNNDIYAILKNYPGESIEEFLSEFKMTKTLRMESDGLGNDSSAEIKQLEVPYQAREKALNSIRGDIFKDSMSLDAEKMTGNSLTNVAIKAAMINLDLKADLFEMNVLRLMDNIVSLYLEFVNKPNEEYNVKFSRRTLVNESEEIDNLLKIREDIDQETFLSKLPNVDNEEIKNILEKKKLEAESTFSFEDENNQANEENLDVQGALEVAEEVTSKPLNGAQTQSLLQIITQYSSNAISEGQAVNLISVSIGLSKAEARKILQGAE